MNLFNKPAVKVLLLVELIAIGGYVTNYISLNQLLLVLGVVMLTFGIFVYKWSQAKKEDNNDS